MSCIDPHKDPRGFISHNQFPHHIAGKLYMTVEDFLADFDAPKPVEIEKPTEDPADEDIPPDGSPIEESAEESTEDPTDEAKDLRAKLKAADVKGWGPRTKLEDLRKLAEGL